MTFPLFCQAILHEGQHDRAQSCRGGGETGGRAEQPVPVPELPESRQAGPSALAHLPPGPGQSAQHGDPRHGGSER